MALVKKKRHLNQLKTYEGALSLLEQQKMMLDDAEMMKKIYKTMIINNEFIKKNQVNIEELEAAKEEFDEMKDKANEISEFFQSVNEEELNGLDEDMKELENQIAEEDNMKLPNAIKEESVDYKNEKNKEDEVLENILEDS